MAIDQPQGIVHLKTFNLLDASGWLAANVEPRAVWGAMLEGQLSSPPPNPWDSEVPVFVEGTIYYDGPSGKYLWQIMNVPGARGSCLEDTFVLWYAREDDSEMHHEMSAFTGDSVGSGCSGGGGDNVAASRHIAQPAPKSLSLLMEPVAPNTPAQTILLEYDELRSTPAAMTWRSARKAESPLQWQLQVVGGQQGLTGILTRFDYSAENGYLPMTWIQSRWNLMHSNRLGAPSGQKSINGEFPSITVEPLL